MATGAGSERGPRFLFYCGAVAALHRPEGHWIVTSSTPTLDASTRSPPGTCGRHTLQREEFGAGPRARTANLLIQNQALYQLS